MIDDPLIGRQVANFRIERVIGRGGMAQVYYGRDVKLERPVAIKIIDARYRDDPAYARRFVREAQTVATWRHENIVQVFFADEEDGLYYFVMEYIDGPSLADLLAQHEAEGELLPREEVLRIGRAIASALDYAHQKGVVHRDVKPANVMMTGDGRVILTDFGLAMDVQQGTQGEVFGSSHYIAPEQARSSANAVPRSDQYSLGIILFEMLTGVVPFDDPSPTSVALQHVTQPPPPPRQINPDLSPKVEAILLKVLSKSPDGRFRTGEELIQALAGALQADPADAAGQAQLPPLPADAPQLEDSLLGCELDEYRIDALLGRGGMARIYRGLDVRTKRLVAIKVIDTPFRSDSDYTTRFEREAQAIAQLEHPNIVRLYRYGEADGVLYIAMQYIEGSTLLAEMAAYRHRQTFMPPRQASGIVRDVCLSLDYAHSRGVIHRDVKPSNIMLTGEGQAILTDFGLALLTDVGTLGEVLGSLHYVAPEQAISSAGAVPQSDLYAVGVILYEIFTGCLPFDAEDPLDIALMHMSDPPRPPRKLRPDLSPELEAVILRAMAKDPGERYLTGVALADALDAALQLTPAEMPTVAAPVAALASKKVVGEDARPLPPIPAAVVTAAPQPDASSAAVPDAVPTMASPRRKRRWFYPILGVAGVLAVVLLAFALWQNGMFAGWGISVIGPPAPTDTALAPSPTAEAVALATSGPTAVVLPSDTPSPSATTAPTETPTTRPTATETPLPESTPTRKPTATAMPTETPLPTATSTKPPTPTPTLVPTATPTPLPSTLAELRNWILFLSDRDGQATAFAMRPDGSEVIALPDRRLYNAAAGKETVHPGGLWRLEVRSDEGNTDIWRVGGGGEYRLTSNPASDYDPAWSPDGNWIVFVSGRHGSDDILLMAADLQSERRLTEYPGHDKHPSWSPDGRYIVFWSDREGDRKQIWLLDLVTGSLINLSSSPYDDQDPVWVK